MIIFVYNFRNQTQRQVPEPANRKIIELKQCIDFSQMFKSSKVSPSSKKTNEDEVSFFLYLATMFS